MVPIPPIKMVNLGLGGRVCENVFTTSPLNIWSNLQICLDLVGKASRSSGPSSKVMNWGLICFTERQPMDWYNDWFASLVLPMFHDGLGGC